MCIVAPNLKSELVEYAFQALRALMPCCQRGSGQLCIVRAEDGVACILDLLQFFIAGSSVQRRGPPRKIAGRKMYSDMTTVELRL